MFIIELNGPMPSIANCEIPKMAVSNTSNRRINWVDKSWGNLRVKWPSSNEKWWLLHDVFFRDPDGTRKTRTPTHPCVQWPGSWSRVQSVFPKGPDTARCNLDMEISWRCRCKMGYDEDILSMSFSISLVYHLAPWKIGISPFILYIYTFQWWGYTN